MFQPILQEIQEQSQLCELQREGLEAPVTRGFIIDQNDELVLLACVNGNVAFDGYTVLRQDDVSFCYWRSPILLKWQNSLRGALGDLLRPGELDIEEWSTLLGTAQSRFPLLGIRRESSHEALFVTRSLRLHEDIVSLDVLDMAGDEAGALAFHSSEISQVEFGGAYLRSFERFLKS